MTVRPARDEELDAAIRLIVPPSAARMDPSQAREMSRLAILHRHDAGGIWVAEQNGQLLSAILPLISPGRTMLIFPPASTGVPFLQQLARQLIEQACAQAAREGVHLAQALIDPHQAEAQSLLSGCGFARLAELLYMQATVRRGIEPVLLPPGYRWVNYSEPVQPLFAHAILASYHGSLDCPGLNGLRHTDDILAGHKATGQFDPGLWFALCTEEATVAVLLLSRVPRTDSLELVYLGLSPEQRGRGLGDLLVRHAIACASAEGCRHLSLAVDASNLPAMRLYWRHGMQAIGRKVAMLRDLRCASTK